MTLIEVIVAIILLSMALMFVFLLFTRGMDALKQANRKILLVQLTQSKMEEYITDKTIAKTGNFSDKGYSDCNFQITVKPYGTTTTKLDQVTVKVWDRVRSVTLSNVIAQ